MQQGFTQKNPHYPPNFPEAIRSIFFDSSSVLRNNYNYYPSNKCILLLDFSRPKIIDFSLLVSQETPNSSNINVSGKDATWVNGVYHEFNSLIKSHPSTAQWLHRQGIYDLFLWVFGFPMGFWGCFKATEIINKLTSSVVLQTALYIYLFLAVLFGFQFLFRYTRWIWPLLEYRCSKDRTQKHKTFWYTIVVTLGLSFLYDILKSFFHF